MEFPKTLYGFSGIPVPKPPCKLWGLEHIGCYPKSTIPLSEECALAIHYLFAYCSDFEATSLCCWCLTRCLPIVALLLESGAKIHLKNILYVPGIITPSPQALVHRKISPIELWHRRYGHIYYRIIPSLSQMASPTSRRTMREYARDVPWERILRNLCTRESRAFTIL